MDKFRGGGQTEPPSIPMAFILKLKFNCSVNNFPRLKKSLIFNRLIFFQTYKISALWFSYRLVVPIQNAQRIITNDY